MDLMSLRSMKVAMLIITTLSLALSGCGFRGLNSLPIPGAQGTAEGSYQLKAIVPNANNLIQNSPVRLRDATVGSVGRIEVKDWKAQVTLRLNKEIKVDRGSSVMVGMTSVLGSMHIEIVPPAVATGTFLTNGEVLVEQKCAMQNPRISSKATEPVSDITIAQQVANCSYPTTEQVLSSLSVVLNGGGLSQLGSVTHELNALFTGRQDVIRKLIPQMNTFVGQLNSQRNNIIRALEGLNTLAAHLNSGSATIKRALADGPTILQLLIDQRPKFTAALEAMSTLSRTTDDILKANTEDIKYILANFAPFLDELQKSGPSITQSLGTLFTFPFPEKYLHNMARGDYMNMDVALDLTFDRLGRGIYPSIVHSRAYGPEALLGPSPDGNIANPFAGAGKPVPSGKIPMKTGGK